MPEGDTIHRAAARLRRVLEGAELTRVEIRRDPRGRRGPEPTSRVLAVEAVGKHLLITFDSGHVLHTHLQMNGAWHVYRHGERWRRAGHRARVIIETAVGDQAVCFDAPTVEIRHDAHRGPLAAPTRAARTLAQLGPDLTVDDPDLDTVLARADAADSRTETGVVLLDQRIGAGIGNVFKSEVCWAEAVSPFVAFGDLAPAVRRALFTTAHHQLRANVERTRRVTYGRGLAVYRRTGRPCPRCGTAIRSAMQGTDLPRRTYWCPGCQHAGPPA